MNSVAKLDFENISHMRALYFFIDIAYIKTIPKLEGHFFDRVTNLGPADELSDDEICKAREKYQSMFPVKQLLEAKQKGLGIVSFEKTPVRILTIVAFVKSDSCFSCYCRCTFVEQTFLP